MMLIETKFYLICKISKITTKFIIICHNKYVTEHASQSKICLRKNSFWNDLKLFTICFELSNIYIKIIFEMIKQLSILNKMGWFSNTFFWTLLLNAHDEAEISQNGDLRIRGQPNATQYIHSSDKRQKNAKICNLTNFRIPGHFPTNDSDLSFWNVYKLCQKPFKTWVYHKDTGLLWQ